MTAATVAATRGPKRACDVLGRGRGVLDHVVQDARRDDLVVQVAAAEQRGDLERVQDERRVVGLAQLARVHQGRVLHRPADRRALGQERRDRGVAHAAHSAWRAKNSSALRVLVCCAVEARRPQLTRYVRSSAATWNASDGAHFVDSSRIRAPSG